MEGKTSRKWRRVMLFWTWFQGIGAVFGGAMGMVSPDGSLFGGQSMIASVQGVGLDSLLLPALGLFVLIGIGNLVSAVLIMRGRRAGAILGCAEGLVITCFTIAEIVILGSNPLSDVYCVFGAVQFACGLRYLHVLGAAEHGIVQKDRLHG